MPQILKRTGPIRTIVVAGVVAALLGSSFAVANTLITSKDIKNGTIKVADLSKKLRTKINQNRPAGAVTPGANGEKGATGAAGAAGATGPAGQTGPAGPEAGSDVDPAWGELMRNEYGSPTAQTGTTAPVSPDGDGALVLATANNEEKAEYGTETELAGLKIASLTTVSFEEFLTDNDLHTGAENQPNIQIEVNPKVAGQTYSSLVFDPSPSSAANQWSTVDAAGPVTGNGGWYFSNGATATATECGQNAGEHFCTLAEIQAKAPDAEVSYSVGLGKGRDHQFQGAVDNLKINGTDYDFTQFGVVKK